MQKELTVGDRSVTVFLQDGFFNNVESKVSHHSHSNTELHLVIRGRTEYMVSGKYLQLGKCQLAVIPGGMFHGGWNPEPDTLRIAFQISWPVQAPLVLRVQEREAEGLWDAVEEYKRTGNAVRMCLYIALICSYLKLIVIDVGLFPSWLLLSSHVFVPLIDTFSTSCLFVTL